MVNSKTKYEATLEEIRELFSFHKLGNLTGITTLGNGEFNAAYRVVLDSGTSLVLLVISIGFSLLIKKVLRKIAVSENYQEAMEVLFNKKN
ncbi:MULTISPECIES: hypothetical protein [unclassified Butyrivibrio]|uniref:hypothetical protein n=1 Tax=unclassified Butyrivibrio TaxID=2639466 RepID=UPI000429184E|nr:MULTISPECIES: hypothetical protein [unclassified Butyrivibrio]